MSNTEKTDGKIVSVTSQGQATIPKEFREKLNLQTPGRVKFREDEDGNITIEQVRDIRDFQGIAPSETPLTAELHEERERDHDREEKMATEFSNGGS
jgi:AbrB family looped-hinge helix DNA binding protein